MGSYRPARGTLDNVTDVGTGCGGGVCVARRAMLVRTAKSCGPDAPPLASRLQRLKSRCGRWWQESPVTRERTYKSSNHCAGKAGLLPLNLYAHVRFLLMHIAHETAGAARTRLSLRPLLRVACALLLLGANEIADLGQCVSRECGSVSHRHCERSEAIQCREEGLDCFVAALLAMTVWIGCLNG